MSFLDYLNRIRSGASCYFTPSPSSRSDGLPSLAGSSIASSATPQLLQTSKSINDELPIVKLPSYSELIAQLGDVDMDCTVDRFNSYTPPLLADPRATPAHCTPSYSYSPPQHVSNSEVYATHRHHHHHQPCCTHQPHYRPSSPFDQVSPDFDPISIRLHTVSPTRTYDHDLDDHHHYNPMTNITGTNSGTSAVITSSSSASGTAHSHVPDSRHHVYEAESCSPAATQPKIRRIRHEQPMSKSREAFKATPRTTAKPARARSTKTGSGTPQAKRLPAHTMPFFATLFPKGVRNYTGVPRDEKDDRENFFTDEELMEMMPSGYQRWQDAVNRFKTPAHTKEDLAEMLLAMDECERDDICGDIDMDDDASSTDPTTKTKGKREVESWEPFARKAKGQFGIHGEQLYHCKMRKKGGEARCAYPQSRQAVRRHINDVHLGLRPWACAFSNCKARFKQRTNLAIHTYSVHTGQTPFHCPDCDEQFSDPAVRHEHREKMHPGTIKKRKQKAYHIPYIEDA